MKELTLSDYQEQAMDFAVNAALSPAYMLAGISEEVGELQGKIAKAIRKGQIQINGNSITIIGFDNKEREEWNDLVEKEIGDILWFVSGLAYVFNRDLNDVAWTNLGKLQARRENGTIVGEGDGVTKEERL